jgi:hypothetical protein
MAETRKRVYSSDNSEANSESGDQSENRVSSYTTKDDMESINTPGTAFCCI